MKHLLIVLLSFCLTPIFGQGTEAGSFDFDGLSRDYFVYLPANYTPGDALPLVFNFHGITSNAGEQNLYTGLAGGMNAVADTGNFIVCYPNGTPIPTGDDGENEWNVGFSFSSSTADDVGFINALIDTLHKDYQINLDRVYATGLSNGGYFSYRLACELPGRIQAVASVAGSIVPEMLDKCWPNTSVPVMQIHGTNDLVVPFDGFQHGISVDDLIQKWLNLNYCSSEVERIEVPDINITDTTTSEKFTYSDCHSNRQVVLFKVDNGGHTWPGSTFYIGTTSLDFNASREIWEFFNQYQTPIAVNTKEVELPVGTIQAQPNPFQDQLQLTSEAPLQSIRVHNLLGQEIYRATGLTMESFNLDTQAWDKGVYFLQVNSEAGWQNLKVIKH